LFLYDRSAGAGAFYSVDAQGGLRLIKQYDDFRKTWDIAVTGNFAPGGLFLYDRSAGTGAFYSVDAQGGLRLIKQYDDFRKNWDIAVTGNFAPGGLFLYDRSVGTGAFYSVDAQGDLRLIKQYDDFRKTWSLALAGVPRETAVLTANNLGAQNITISDVQVVMNSEGFWQFTGHANEGGFAGGSYTYGLALDFADPTGKVIGFLQQDSLDGTSDPFGTHDKDWTQQGQNSLISDNWGIILTKGCRYHLDATTDPAHVIEAVGGALLDAIGFTAGFVLMVWISALGSGSRNCHFVFNGTVWDVLCPD